MLLYHRIQSPDGDPWSLCVSPQNFAAHLAVLRRHARPVSLESLCRAVNERRRLPRSVVVSFDDGYLDNLTQAAPLLQRFDVPATFFIASGFLDQAQAFWWDELELLLLRPGHLAPTLALTVRGRTHHWPLGEAALYTNDDFTRHRSWQAGGDSVPTARHRAYVELHRLLLDVDDEERRGLMDQLATSAGVQRPAALESGRPLTRAEARALAAIDGMDLGAHTRTHPALDRLPAAQQRREILDGRRDLESLLQRPVTRFAYPYGRHASTTPDLVRDLGFDCACTVNAGDVRADSDAFQLNRNVVCNWTGDEFARRLERWLGVD